MSTDLALAYTEGYLAALDACEKTDVAKLIKERDALVAEKAFAEACSRILERRLAETIVALGPFAKAADQWNDTWTDDTGITVGDLRRSKEVLNNAKSILQWGRSHD